jgi:hypothetical protein
MVNVNNEKEQNIVKAYRMFQKLLRYPNLLDSMRETFLEALSERGVVDAEMIEKEAIAMLQDDGKEPNEEQIREYSNILIDLYFASHFSEEEIENYVNLSRKQDRFKHLNRVINMEGATSKKIKQALAEFCIIPMGDLHISPNEAEGVRVALINHFISNQLPFIGIGGTYMNWSIICFGADADPAK